MTKKELYEVRRSWLFSHYKYKLIYYKKFDYDVLSNVMYTKRRGKGKNDSWSDAIMMADTETSKKCTEKECENHVCAWTLSIRAFDMNLVTLHGHDPYEFTDCLQRIRDNIPGDNFILYFHNLPYDWTFLRKFLMEKFGRPEKQLNVKPHYPLFINFENGLQIRDSLILAQRSLEKWAADMKIEHQKAVGFWDYEKIRSQKETFTRQELIYIEHDTLAGVECIEAMCKALNKQVHTLPYTATGIPREEVRKRGKINNARQLFNRISITYETYKKLEKVFHGGFTHANRHLIGYVIEGKISCFDFASSYPFIMCSEKMPAERFWRPKPRKWSKDYVLQNMDDFAFIFKIKCKDVKLKDPRFPMPAISFSKCIMSVNALEDNGRILKADYLETYVNEIDFQLINSLYDFECEIEDLQCAVKDYLPKWLTDYVYKRFQLKTQLKGVDPVLYQIEKAKLNSIFGMSAQKCVKEEIMEDYASGEYSVKEDFDHVKAYERYLKNRNTFLPYCIGIWVTSAAQRNLFRLGSCVPDSELWLYSDTDSVYATGFDEEKVEAYNKECKEKLLSRGYGAVLFKDREYWLGVAEDDGEYTQFTALHAKCYCNRKLTGRGEGFVMADPLKITVAGVPKKGAKSLENKIENFREGFLFEGTISGKLQHTHYFIDKIYVDKNGNETGDSIELSPCDYVIKGSTDADFDLLLEEEVEMIDYENADDE